jgi:hypothetical protein
VAGRLPLDSTARVRVKGGRMRKALLTIVIGVGFLCVPKVYASIELELTNGASEPAGIVLFSGALLFTVTRILRRKTSRA